MKSLSLLNMDRRAFLETAAAAVVGATLSIQKRPESLELPRRILGKTGEKVSMLGLGGYHLAVKGEENAIALIHRALERGINFIDSADCYLGGNSERFIGKALRDRREGVFVMTKVDQRDREGSRLALETSLRNLQMETIDLWQFHAVPSIADVERIFGPGGAMETAAAAKKEGWIRYIGITGHTLPEALAHAVSNYHDVLDTVQMPVNPLDASYSSFQKEVLPLTNQYQLGALAMKTAVKGTLFKQKIATPQECLRYAWSQPVSIVISGMETIPILEENIRTAQSCEPMTEEEQAQLVSRVSQYAGTNLEDYKQKRRA